MSQEPSTANAWWTTLRHGGVLISPLVLDEALDKGPESTPDWQVDKLRRAYLQFTQRPEGAAGMRHLEQNLGPWLDMVFETFLGHTAPNWQKGPNVSDRFKHTEATGSIRKPNRVLTNATKEHEPRFIVLIDKDRLLKDDGTPGQIGVHGGRRTYGQLLGLMRATNVKLGILTNGFQFRLVYAGLDTDSWAEWSADAWFQGGDGRRTLDGLKALLGVEHIPPSSDSSAHTLLELVEESRKRQADLSHVMGTQVREAVELLLNALDDNLAVATPEQRESILAPLRRLGLQRQAELDALYQAAIRVVMRLVVTAYAESRELFPISQPAYLQSYSLDALFRELQQAKIEEGLDALSHQEGAWARLVSHARLVHGGSRHPSLQMVAYGGRLFEAPGASPTDAVMAALAVLEAGDVRISDATVQRILELLKIGKFKANRGKWLTGPVDFSDLRTEYIGMMYEGLLDYQLREAREEDGGILVLNLGEQPALPLRVLTSLTDERLKKLITELRKQTAGVLEDDDPNELEEAGDDAPAEGPDDDEIEEPSEDLSGDPVAESSTQGQFEAEAMAWAERAVQLNPTAFLTAKVRRERDATIRRKEEQKAARRLLVKSIRPGGTYLVRWSGTRKGSGTFYTKPALAVPAVARTLEPLAYQNDVTGAVRPRAPDEILDLKVCDPAAGSGSFPVAALRFLSKALRESIDVHVLRPSAPQAPEMPRSSPAGHRVEGILNERILPLITPTGGEGDTAADEARERRLESMLKRAIVENCIYAVDLNPIAVELCKLSLWIETMDRELPFNFIDHKVKQGNSIVGARLRDIETYPAAAWLREGGDGPNGEQSKRLRTILRTTITPELATFAQRQINRTLDVGLETTATSQKTLERARTRLKVLHRVWDESDRERAHRELESDEDLRGLRARMDLWCAIWFWPLNAEARELPGPAAYYSEKLDERVAQTAGHIARSFRFFHWEIEFPDVFTQARNGFDATIGNPPWDTVKPNSLEFFIRYRPEYRTYGKQDALRVQRELFKSNAAIEREWHAEVARLKALSNYVARANSPAEIPVGKTDREGQPLARWKARNPPDATRPFQYQDGPLNLYKIFVEIFTWISRKGGRWGLICPSGIYSDHGTRLLRSMLLSRAGLELVYSFENRKKIFPIDSRFKFCVAIGTNGLESASIRVAFLVTETESWQSPNLHLPIIERATIDRLSPNSGTLLEITHERDLAILEKMYASGQLLGKMSGEWAISTGREYDLTEDSDIIRPREELETKGFVRGPAAVWKAATGERAVPTYVGALIHQFDLAFKEHLSAREWRHVGFPKRQLVPNLLMKEGDRAAREKSSRRVKVIFRDIARATDQRTMIAALVPGLPCGNSVRVAKTEMRPKQLLSLLAVFNSYAFDFALRMRIGSTHLHAFYLEEMPFPTSLVEELDDEIVALSGKLSLDPILVEIHPELSDLASRFPFESDPRRRAELRDQLDALVARAYGLDPDDLRWIIRTDNPDPRRLSTDSLRRASIRGGTVEDVSQEEDPTEEM